MKKQLLALTAFLLVFTAGRGQTNIYHPFPDSNATWNFHFGLYCFVNGIGDENFSVTFSGDTLINSQNYHKLDVPFVQSFSTGICGGYATGYKGAIRQDTANRKVFFVPPADTAEKLLYDFTLQVGDTVRGHIQSFSFPWGADVVLSIDSVLVGTSYRKRWYINMMYNIYLIEGIGSTYGLFEPSPGNVTDMADYSLLCFEQNSQTLYPNTTTSCQLITSAHPAEKHAYNMTVFPNPFSAETRLQAEQNLQNATLIVHNAFGQQVKRMENISGQGISFQRGDLPNGLYFFHLRENSRIVATGKLLVADH